MRLLVLFSVLLFVCLPRANAKTTKYKSSAKDKMVMHDMQRYILTWEQLSKLSANSQVEYYKFLVRFIAVLEDTQPKMDKSYYQKKTAVLELLKKLTNELNPQAYAANGYQQTNDASMIGKACIYGARQSVYAEFQTASGPRYWCMPLGNDSCALPMHTECNPALFNWGSPNGTNGPLCVPTFPENETATEKCLTERCVDAFEARLGGRMNDVVKAEMAKIKGDKNRQKEWNDFVKQMKSAVNTFEDSKDSSGTSMKDYCKADANGRYNSMNFGKQHPECQALDRLFTSIKDSDVQSVIVTPTRPLPPAPKVGGDLYAKCHNDQTRPELGDLQCLNCAIREAGPGSRGDASKWIALLALTAKTQQKNEAGDSVKNRVVKMLLSTSYCTDDEYPNDPGFNPNSPSAKGFGFSGDRAIKNLLGDYENADASGFPWNFEGHNIFYRRTRYGYNFRISNSNHSSNLTRCLRSAHQRLTTNPTFNYCAKNDVELNNPTLRGDNSENSTDLGPLLSFCNNLARACGDVDTSICTKDSLIATNKTLNEKERRTKGEYGKKGISPQFGYYSQNFEMSGNQARCPRREASVSVGGGDNNGPAATGPGATGPAASSPSGGGSGSH